MAYEIGDRISVKFTGRTSAYYLPYKGAAKVKELDEAGIARNVHYLFLDSERVTGDKTDSGTFQVEFDAEITGPERTADSITTQVREINADGSLGCTHYVFLDAPSVTQVDRSETAPASPAAASSKPEKKERTTVAIDRYNTTIDSDDVDNRIEELEAEQGFDVIRLRNDEVLETFDDRDDAEQFIEDEDYNPVKVVVRLRGLDDGDAEELQQLKDLRDAVGAGDWTLYNEDYFDSSWAREEAMGRLNLRSYQLDEWPLDQIDWNEAADSLRDAQYDFTYSFDGQLFYGDQ